MTKQNRPAPPIVPSAHTILDDGSVTCAVGKRGKVLPPAKAAWGAVDANGRENSSDEGNKVLAEALGDYFGGSGS